MEYTEGKARVNVTTVELSQGAVTSNNNILPGHLFRFQGDTAGYYYVASITDEQHFELTAPYSGTFEQNVDFDYLVVRDFTTGLGLALMEAGDVDIREIFTYDMLLIDAFVGGASRVPSEFAQGTRMIFDQDVPPTGWSRELDTAINDRMIRLTTAVRQHGGTWTITGLSVGAHTHTLHNRLGYEGGTGGPSAVWSMDVPGAVWPQQWDSQSEPAGAAGQSDSSWRPLHRDCIVGCKD